MSKPAKSKKYGISLAIIMIIAIGVTSMYLIPTHSTVIITPETEEDKKRNEALGTAQRFIVTTPTFAFDGDIDSFGTQYVNVLETSPTSYLIKFSFNSAHGGFGNREGQPLTEVITPHKMEIIVSEGIVISAVTDGQWDELNNKFVLKNPKPKMQSSNEPATPFDGKVTDYSSLISAIKSRGLLVDEIEIIDDSFFLVPTKVISVSGIDLQIFEFNTEYDMETAMGIVSSDGTEIGLSIIQWMDAPHFYSQDQIIVQYVGQNPEILNLLDSLLGKQFAGM
jgi:hypothetical protein